VANTQHLHLERSKQGLGAAPLKPQPYYAEYLAVGKVRGARIAAFGCDVADDTLHHLAFSILISLLFC